MSSFKFRVDGIYPSSGGDLVEVTLFAGKDREHRQHSGTLKLRVKEFSDLQCILQAPGRKPIEVEFDDEKYRQWYAREGYAR